MAPVPATQKIVVQSNCQFLHSRAGVFFKGNSEEEIRGGKREVRTLVVDPRIDEAMAITDPKQRTAALETLNYARGEVGEAIGLGQLRKINNDHNLSVRLPEEAIDVMQRIADGLKQSAPEAPADPSPAPTVSSPLQVRFEDDPASLTTTELKKLAEQIKLVLKSVKKADIINEIKKALE